MREKRKSRLIPLTKWNQYHPWPSIAGLRHLIAYSKEKRCTEVFVKAGGRWLVDEEAFLDWAYSSRRA